MPRSPIPEEIRNLVLSNHIGQVIRTDVTRAQDAMAKLAIPPEGEFYTFCSDFCLGNLLSKTSYESLVDVCDPTEEVAAGTKFAHEVWGIPDEYVCFTSCQGEGGYLYSVRTHAIYEFSLADRQCFLEQPKPRWNNFYEFLVWYLSAPEAEL